MPGGAWLRDAGLTRLRRFAYEWHGRLEHHDRHVVLREGAGDVAALDVKNTQMFGEKAQHTFGMALLVLQCSLA